MPDETPTGSARTPDNGGHRGGGTGEQSPLQARAAFFKNWDWESVSNLNRRLCARGSAQFGVNSESGRAAEESWETGRGVERPLGEALDELRAFHRRAPFLFFNGNTFADIGRGLAALIFRELAAGRLRQVTSAIAHYVAGVLDREAMVEIVESLCRAADLQPGMRVKSLAGSMRGVITRIMDDGRVAVRPEGSKSEMISLPENLLPDD